MTATLEQAPVTADDYLTVTLADRPTDRDRAAALVAAGRIVGVSFASVYGLVGDGLHPALGYDIATIKGRAQLGRPLSVCLPSSRLVEMIDLAHVHPSLRAWALDADGLSWALASRCYLRVPIRLSLARRLPPHLLSYADGVPYLQSLDPEGMPGIEEFMAALYRGGVEFPALTSMNLSGRPEITEFPAALRFARAAGLPMLLLGRNHPRGKGSLSILELGPSGLSMARNGTVSLAALQRSINAPIRSLG
jgi:tRNA A37 threonylcarbamoyladenosine synthetase subunit TsaC/SUA5/YrdC